MNGLKLGVMGFLIPFIIMYVCGAYGYLTLDVTKFDFVFRCIHIVFSLFVGVISFAFGDDLDREALEDKWEKRKEASSEK